MNKEDKNNSRHQSQTECDNLYEFPGYPLYPRSEDIFNKSKEEQEIDPEDITQLKERNEKGNYLKQNRTSHLEDLDVPGSELDDAEEKIGSEDEENNYYSLGGDEHDDLEEDKGD